MRHNRYLIPFLLLIALLVVACGSDDPARTASSTELTLGQEVYAANCASCHGVEGEGEPNWRSPDDSGSFPAPPHDETGHTWHHPDPLLLQVIAEGGQMPNTRMPGFGDKLTQAEMEAVLAYIKTFWTPQQRETQADITQRSP